MSEQVIERNKINPIKQIAANVLLISSFVLVTVYSHLLPFPLYVIEPMRIILLLTIIFTNKANQYFFAIILPLISFFLSGHPPIEKSLIIVCELCLNVAIFNLFQKKNVNIALNIGLSILLSKIGYYIIKITVYSLILNEAFSLGNERIFQQIGVIIGLSIFGWVIRKLKK